MKINSKVCLLMIFSLILFSSSARADKNNTFSGSLFLGDSYAPTNFRLSFGNFDIGLSDITELYVGTRAWQNNRFAGFGVGLNSSFYGLVGYEWRLFSLGGMIFEFDGMMSVSGKAAGRFYLGFFLGV